MSNIVETGNDQNFENFIYSACSTPFSPAICNISKAKVSYNKFADNFTKMSNMRVIQKHLVYVIGLSANLAFKETHLSKFEFFGQYGRITKLVVNRNKVYNMNGPNGPSYSAYITYSTPEESSLAILALDNSVIEGHVLRASYGTTKYCANYLRGAECFNKECLYLHALADESDIIDRDDMNTNKSIFTSQHYLAMRVADIFNPEKKNRLFMTRQVHTVFPSPFTIYSKDIVIDQLRRASEDSATLSTNTSSLDNNLSYHLTPVFRERKTSRFGFCISSNNDEGVRIPSFVSYILAKKCSQLAFYNSYNLKGEDPTYLDKTLIREYSDNNPWAREIIGNCGNEIILIQIERLAEKEQMNILMKFNSA